MQPEDKTKEIEDMIVCSEHTDEVLTAIWENNGFEPPDPTHWEISGYENCPSCK